MRNHTKTKTTISIARSTMMRLPYLPICFPHRKRTSIDRGKKHKWWDMLPPVSDLRDPVSKHMQYVINTMRFGIAVSVGLEVARQDGMNLQSDGSSLDLPYMAQQNIVMFQGTESGRPAQNITKWNAYAVPNPHHQTSLSFLDNKPDPCPSVCLSVCLSSSCGKVERDPGKIWGKKALKTLSPGTG